MDCAADADADEAVAYPASVDQSWIDSVTVKRASKYWIKMSQDKFNVYGPC